MLLSPLSSMKPRSSGPSQRMHLSTIASGLSGLTPELSRPARGEPGSAEAAKRARLERIVSPQSVFQRLDKP